MACAPSSITVNLKKPPAQQDIVFTPPEDQIRVGPVQVLDNNGKVEYTVALRVIQIGGPVGESVRVESAALVGAKAGNYTATIGACQITLKVV